ncbi:hypothetical protein QQS21_003121 [Conoideocrella luteorostrata]|uniref:Uncharacterized protein n=1 Tax=Conoideocrella luteorostrata TaxID=1105319 RepID=A0AAJ0CUQ5_9HYPO|nr:hypothetical protein QQS21_003121 [Conoideocrella luteorostrata]
MSSTVRPLALVTGSTQGIGLAVTQILAREHSYHVLLGVRQVKNGEIIAGELREEGHQASVIELDLSSERSVAAAIENIEKNYGYLDVLINNAGILIDRRPNLSKWDLYATTFTTNVIGAGVLTDGLAPLLLKAKSGPPRIVFVSSIMGSLEVSLDKTTMWYGTDYKVYDASKAAVNMLAVEFARVLDDVGGKSNAVCPDLVSTAMTGFDRRGETAETGATRIVELAVIGHDGPTGQHEHAPLFGDVGLESFEEFIGSVVEWNAVDESLEMVNRTETSSDNVTTYSSPSAEYFIAKSRATRALTPLSQDTSTSRHAANLISRIVGAFPQMMLRRHTFPPFIHSYWHEPVVPANLANCMSIAQLFVSRTSDTRPFLWRTIEAEQQRLLDQKYMFTAPEVQQAIQAMTIYIVMAIIDQDEDTPARGARLMQAFMDLKIQLQCLIGGDLVISETEAANPSATWEDWIFAESRRRLGCLWFAITRVFALKTDRAHCASMDDFHNLPLLSGKCIWETRTREEWDIERHLDDSNYPLVTLGELLTALKAPGDAVYGRKLKNWEAGVDKLGMTMNIAAELAA